MDVTFKQSDKYLKLTQKETTQKTTQITTRKLLSAIRDNLKITKEERQSGEYLKMAGRAK